MNNQFKSLKGTGKRKALSNLVVIQKITDILEEMVTDIPQTNEKYLQFPEERVNEIIMSASLKSAAYSGALAVPPGPYGFLTILPDLYGVWRIQAQMVVDIAGVYGRDCNLTKEHMIYCLFKQAVSQFLRDVIVRCGTKIIVKSITKGMMKQILRKIGIHVTGKSAGRAVSRWMPVIGIIGAGGYSFYDTRNVGKNARELFNQSIACA